MTVLASEVHENIDISSSFETLSFENTEDRDLVVLCTIMAGSPSQPLAGAGLYFLRAKIDGSEILPESSISVGAQPSATMQSRQVTLRIGQTLTVELQGQVGDTSVDVSTFVTDVTPALASDLLGEGTIPVDHDYGGVDNLRVVDPEGAGIGSVGISAYLAVDYAAGERSASFVRGATTTNAQGRWRAPISLDPGEYTLVLSKPEAYETTTTALTVS